MYLWLDDPDPDLYPPKGPTMNRTAVYVLSALAVILALVAAAYVGADVRERVLTAQCIQDGGSPAWQGSSPDDQRPNGFLPFHCLPR